MSREWSGLWGVWSSAMKDVPRNVEIICLHLLKSMSTLELPRNYHWASILQAGKQAGGPQSLSSIGIKDKLNSLFLFMILVS